MITERNDPPGLATIAGAANVTVATGNRIIHISGQTGVDADGNLVGATHLEQSKRALANLRVAVESTGASLADVAKLNIYVVDYTPDALDALVAAAIEVLGEDFPVTASTLVGVATLWQPGILVEIDAVVVV
jgi:enamine deaminase RidA (YjgF/YER057c/UK114 family)